MAATMMQTASFVTSSTARPAATQCSTLMGMPLLPLRQSAPVANRRAAIIPCAGPLDRFSNQVKKKSGTDPKGYEPNTPESAFTRGREVVAGRLAMTGFFAELVGELVTGKGAVGQLSLETLLPRPLIAAGIAAIVLFNFATALNPAGPTFTEENQRDVRKRPYGGVQKPSKTSLVQNPRKTLGISKGFGFTKANELFVGRLAMIGFAASLVGEYFQNGKGPLGQLGIPMPAYAEYAGFGLAGWILFFFAAAIGSGNFPGEKQGAEDMY
jgi:photosystem II protein